MALTHEELTKIFKRWYKPLRQWISRMNVRSNNCDDVAQEVFVRLLRYPTAEPIENIQGYIFRIAANVVNEHNERAVFRKPHDADWLEDLIEEPDHQPDIEHEDNDETEKIERCIQQLPPRWIETLRLHMNEGLTYKQIADKTGHTYRTVLRDLTRTYTRLRELLAMEDARLPISVELKHRRVLEAKRLLTPKAPPPINARTVRLALDSNRYCMAAAGEFFQITGTQMLRLARKHVPDFEETRERLRAEEHAATAARILAALEATGWNLAEASVALGQCRSYVCAKAHLYIPDFEERRAAYFQRIKDEEQKQREDVERREAEAKRIAEEAEAKRLADEAEARRADVDSLQLLERLEAHLTEEAEAKRRADAAQLLSLLEAHEWALRPAAQSINMGARRLTRIVADLIPDWETRRREWMAARDKVPRSELAYVSDQMLLQALEANAYNVAATARALGRSDDRFDFVCRRLLPDFDERKKKFLEERERLQKAAADKRWEQELARRSAFFSDLNRKRWEGTADARRTEHLARLAQLERERAELIEANAKEQTALALEEAEKIRQVEQEYEARRTEMRQRQIGARRRLTTLIHGIIDLIPGYRAHRREMLNERKATQAAQISAALDATGGAVRPAARLLAGLSPQVVRIFKLKHWMNQEEGVVRIVLAIPVAMARRVMPEFPNNAPMTRWELMKCPLCNGEVWVGHTSREAFNAGQAEVCCITCAYTRPEGHRAYRILMREGIRMGEPTKN